LGQKLDEKTVSQLMHVLEYILHDLLNVREDIFN